MPDMITNVRFMRIDMNGTNVSDWGDKPIYTTNELIKCEFTVNVSGDASPLVNGQEIYFCPALREVSYMTGKPDYGFKIIYSSAMLSGAELLMSVLAPALFPALTNYYATIHFNSATEFVITFYYFLTFDLQGFVRSLALDNHGRFLKQSYDDPTELVASLSNTYFNPAINPDFALYVHVRKPDPSGTTYTEEFQKSYDSPANWYGHTGVATAHSFTLQLNGSDVNGIGLFEDTKLIFTFTPVNPANTFKVCLGMFNTQNHDPSKDFVDNYQLSYVQGRLETGTATTLHNKLKSPSSDIIDNGDGTFSIYCHVDYTKVDQGAYYRFYAVIYDTPDNLADVQTCLSDEYSTGLVRPIACDVEWQSWLEDFNGRYLGNRIQRAVTMERIRANIYIGYFFNQIADYINQAFGVIGSSNNIATWLDTFSVELLSDDPVTGFTHRYAYANAHKPGGIGTHYFAPTSLDIDQSDPTNFMRLTYDFRIRHESWLPCLGSYNNGILGPAQASMNMAGLNCYLKWTFNFEYLYGITDTVTVQQYIDVTGNLETDVKCCLVINPDSEHPTSYCSDTENPNPIYVCNDEEIQFTESMAEEEAHPCRIPILIISPGQYSGIALQEHDKDVASLLPRETSPDVDSLNGFDGSYEALATFVEGALSGQLQVEEYCLNIISKLCRCDDPLELVLNTISMNGSATGIDIMFTFTGTIGTVCMMWLELYSVNDSGVAISPRMFTPTYQANLVNNVLQLTVPWQDIFVENPDEAGEYLVVGILHTTQAACPLDYNIEITATEDAEGWEVEASVTPYTEGE